MISIIMLVHNAKIFTKHTILTLAKTKTNEEYELIVVDNNSNGWTKRMLLNLQKRKLIDKLVLLKENTFFAKGNNIGSQICNPKSEYIILMNSDIEIRNSKWLDLFMKIHEKGASCMGLCENNPYTRGDGYCFLIDKDLYEKYKLDESFEWWWSVTKLEAELLRDGYKINVIKNHENLMHHYGGMSGNAYKKSKGLQIEGDDVKKWFGDKTVKVIEKLETEDKNNIKVFTISNVLAKFKSIKKKLKTKIKAIIKGE